MLEFTIARSSASPEGGRTLLRNDKSLVVAHVEAEIPFGESAASIVGSNFPEFPIGRAVMLSRSGSTVTVKDYN